MGNKPFTTLFFTTTVITGQNHNVKTIKGTFYKSRTDFSSYAAHVFSNYFKLF